MLGSGNQIWLAVAIALAPLAVEAQPTNCMPRDVAVAALEADYSEALLGQGLQNEQQLLEVFMSENGESWTVLQSFPNGVSCIVASGTDWLVKDRTELAGITG